MLLVVFDLAQEHLNSMGVGQWPRFAGGEAWPLFTHSAPESVQKRLAGNVPCLQTLSISLVTNQAMFHESFFIWFIFDLIYSFVVYLLIILHWRCLHKAMHPSVVGSLYAILMVTLCMKEKDM